MSARGPSCCDGSGSATSRRARAISAKTRPGSQSSKKFAERGGEITATLDPKTPVEIWFQDEMRLGRKNPRTRRWARRGTRPRALADRRAKSASLFGAICPERGTGAAVVMPRADTRALQHHLDEIARNLAPKAHAVIVLDQAGWHATATSRVPDHLALPPLPAKAPEPNPTENVWRFPRQTKLSNRLFDGHEAIVEAACDAGNSILRDPARITSIATRHRAVIARSSGRWV